MACGLAGAALFVLIHSLLIFPIWTRFATHLPFALAAGIALATAFDAGAAARKWYSAADGLRFGLIVFATLAPATIFTNALRAAGRPGNDWLGFSGTLILAVIAGASAGWIVARTRRALFAFAASTLTLTIAMGGTIPVVNDSRAAWLFAGFLPICAGAGLTLSVARRCLTLSERS